MNSLNVNLSQLWASYKDWVRRNPQTASEVESTFKWVSYFIAGKINKSVVLTEWVYSVSNLLVLFNDQIIHSAKPRPGSPGDKIKIWLTVLEYSEVFIEISAKSLWGQRGKWIIIICVQLLKCAARLSLLLHHKEKMLPCPPIPTLKRTQNQNEQLGGRNLDGTARINNLAFSLKRSGRVIRKVDTAPPINNRLWKPPLLGPPNNNTEEAEAPDKSQLRQHLTGEVLYIVKPVAHLAAMMRYGQSAWKPLVLSLAMDLTSLYLLHSNPGKRRRPLSQEHHLELSRRHLGLLLYLMRSPFFERHSKDRVNAFLDSLARNVPLARLLCNPIKQYIPFWQETYFYIWSS